MRRPATAAIDTARKRALEHTRRRRTAHQHGVSRARWCDRRRISRRKVRHRLHRAQSRRARRRAARARLRGRGARRRRIFLTRDACAETAAGSRRDRMPSPWDATDGFQLSGHARVELPISWSIGRCGRPTCRYGHGRHIGPVDGAVAGAHRRSSGVSMTATMRLCRSRRPPDRWCARAMFGRRRRDGDGNGGVVRAPMHGKVLAVLVGEGRAVRKGERVAMIEAMKMEHALMAPFDGTVAEVWPRTGASGRRAGDDHDHRAGGMTRGASVSWRSRRWR